MAVMGGEAVCAVHGPGRGGRNLEVVAGSLSACATGTPRALASADTDGLDGNSGLSGAVAWSALAAAMQGRVADALQRSDSASLFQTTDGSAGALRWGPTGANVSDLRIVMR